MSMNWQRAQRNVSGRPRVEITEIEDLWKGYDALQDTDSPVFLEDDGTWYHPDLGWYDPNTGLLKGLASGGYYYLGQMTVEDFGRNMTWVGGFTGDTMGWNLGTFDRDEALRILTQEQGRFNEFTAERSRERARNEDRQVSDLQAQVRALQDYQRSQSMAHSQQMTDLQRQFSRQIEDYNLNIESAFRSVGDLIASLQDSAQSPSTIQTLYLDRQAKTYLPSSIRNRGIAGVMGGQQ